MKIWALAGVDDPIPVLVPVIRSRLFLRIVVDFFGESSASIVSILLPTALRRSYITPHNYLIAFGLGVAIAHGSRLRSTWVAWYRDSYGGGKRVPGCGKGKCNYTRDSPTHRPPQMQAPPPAASTSTALRCRHQPPFSPAKFSQAGVE